MKMRSMILVAVKVIFVCLLHQMNALAQQGSGRTVTDKNELLRLKEMVEKSPDSLNYHRNYIQAMGVDHPELEREYAELMKRHPKNPSIPYALGNAFANARGTKAKEYLLKAIQIDPGFTEAWGSLWLDAERSGDVELGQSYLRRAAESEPNDPNYAFYYASSYGESGDDEKFVRLSLDVVKRFPDHQRGAQALYWLAYKASDLPVKIKYWEQLRASYSTATSHWARGGMTLYFETLLLRDPVAAHKLALELSKDEEDGGTEWLTRAEQARIISDTERLIEKQKFDDALALLNTFNPGRYITYETDLLLYKARLIDHTGDTQAAYDTLITAFVKEPRVLLKTTLYDLGAKLNKSENKIHDEIYDRLYANAEIATPFKGLKRYMTPGVASLSNFRGQIVLLTYWYPGCGPCRAEFPHFENVVRKFSKQDLAYIGLNIVSKENDYVVPFMEKSGYSFIPLEDVEGREKGNLDNRRAAPINFLIDQEGRLIFSNFRTHAENEADLELMISMLLTKNKS